MCVKKGKQKYKKRSAKEGKRARIGIAGNVIKIG